jgi:hypothetical protein
LFKDMTGSTWHEGLDQKVHGTWNLHHGLQDRDHDLDFFLILSSVAGSVGTATESNYCAANAFLDSFASYRRKLGLPATTLGLGMISEVGFLHDNPGAEAALLRKGVHPYTEAELLQLLDISLNETPPEPSALVDYSLGSEHGMQAHLLTGLELHGFDANRQRGFARVRTVLEDPRCVHVAGAFAGNADAVHSAVNAGLAVELPHAISTALEQNPDAKVPNEVLLEAIAATVAKQIASLLLVSADALTQDTLLADFGMESMLAAEFRADMYRAFKVDVPFDTLLDRRAQVATVADMIGRSLLLESSKQ